MLGWQFFCWGGANDTLAPTFFRLGGATFKQRNDYRHLSAPFSVKYHTFHIKNKQGYLLSCFSFYLFLALNNIRREKPCPLLIPIFQVNVNTYMFIRYHIEKNDLVTAINRLLVGLWVDIANKSFQPRVQVTHIVRLEQELVESTLLAIHANAIGGRHQQLSPFSEIVKSSIV